jgi:hypothetical protein
MTFKNTTIQKLISFFIIIGIFTPTLSIFFIPKKADAIVDVFVEPGVIWNAYLIDQTINDNIIAVSVVTETTVAVKETFWRTIIKEALMIIARRMINKMTQATINWINSGFHGNPAFIDNPRSFFGDIVKYEVNSLIRTFTNTARFPFGRNFAKNTINSYQRQLEDNMEYTLSQVTDDRVLLNDLQNDFNTGGWAGFLINTQYPQNNYIGFQMLATKELAKRLDGQFKIMRRK